MNSNRLGLRSAAVVTGLTVLALSMAVAGPAAAHDWQATTTNGSHELGLSATPRESVTGVETAFVAQIRNATEASADEPHGGGVTGATVELRFTAPNGTETRRVVKIPDDDPYFTFNYTFAHEGSYVITVTTTVDGETFAFHTEHVVASSSAGTDQRTTTVTTDRGAENDTLHDDVAVTQLLSGASALFALCALGAAVMAYRGTD